MSWGVIVRRIPFVLIREGTPNTQKHYIHEVMIEKISTDFKIGRANLPGAGVNADSSMSSLLYNIIEVKNGSLKRTSCSTEYHRMEEGSLLTTHMVLQAGMAAEP